MTRERWLIAVIVAIELGAILSHPAESKAIMRTVYDFGWSVLPKPDGYDPPHRFR